MKENLKTVTENQISSIKNKFKSPKRNYNSPKKFNTIEHTHVPKAYPKNANEFRHILEDIKCCHADVDFMLELRRHNKIENIDKIHGNEPSFYHDDLTKYKNKTTFCKLVFNSIIIKNIYRINRIIYFIIT